MSNDPLVERAHAIASRFLAPHTRADRATTPPIEQIRHLAEAGLLGLTTPQEYGGLGRRRTSSATASPPWPPAAV